MQHPAPGTPRTPSHALILPFPRSSQCLSIPQRRRALPAASGMSQKGSYSAGPSAGKTACSSPAQSMQLSWPQHRQGSDPEEPFLPLCRSGLAPQLLSGCPAVIPQPPDRPPATNTWCLLDRADTQGPAFPLGKVTRAGAIPPTTSSTLSCPGHLRSRGIPWGSAGWGQWGTAPQDREEDRACVAETRPHGSIPTLPRACWLLGRALRSKTGAFC